MALEYTARISIAGYTLPVNPDTYAKEFIQMGSFVRTIAGSLVGQSVSANKYRFSIKGLTQSDIEDIKLRAAAELNLTLIDFVPIAEREEITRAVHEALETTTINGQTVYRYIPAYEVAIINYIEEYSGNSVEYTIEAEEL